MNLSFFLSRFSRSSSISVEEAAERSLMVESEDWFICYLMYFRKKNENNIPGQV
jgi:hypothetical protein